MKIGVDASCWGTVRGPGRHARELFRALLGLDRTNEYWFFVDAVTARDDLGLPDGGHRVTVPTRRSAVAGPGFGGE